MHSQPERSVCFIVEGDGWIVVEGQSDFAYAKGDMITFDPDVLHGWRGNNAQTRILVGLLSWSILGRRILNGGFSNFSWILLTGAPFDFLNGELQSRDAQKN
jgi:hypothetical protein